jgi:hypothetical protein
VRNRLDLIFDNRVQAELIYLPAALAFGQELAPRCSVRRRLAVQDLVGSGMHAPTAIGIPHGVACGYPPAMRLRAHLSLLPAPAAYTQGKTVADSSLEATHSQTEEVCAPGNSGLERVTGIEPALSAWEDYGLGHVMPAGLLVRLSVSDRDRPSITVTNCTLIARQETAASLGKRTYSADEDCQVRQSLSSRVDDGLGSRKITHCPSRLVYPIRYVSDRIHC